MIAGGWSGFYDALEELKKFRGGKRGSGKRAVKFRKVLGSAALVGIPVGRRRRRSQSQTLPSLPINLDCERPQQQLFSQPLSWAQFEAASALSNSSTHMSIFYASIRFRGLLRIFRDICEMVAALPEISLDNVLRRRANSIPFIQTICTILRYSCSLKNPREP